MDDTKIINREFDKRRKDFTEARADLEKASKPLGIKPEYFTVIKKSAAADVESFVKAMHRIEERRRAAKEPPVEEDD